MTNLITLYYTDGCHLCDEAVLVLAQTQLTYQKVDIVEHPDAQQQDLFNLYGSLIPVIKKRSGQTLNWPFNLEQLIDFIKKENS